MLFSKRYSLFFRFVFKEVAGSQMVGAHVIDERKDLTNQTMIFLAQLKPELRTRLARYGSFGTCPPYLVELNKVERLSRWSVSNCPRKNGTASCRAINLVSWINIELRMRSIYNQNSIMRKVPFWRSWKIFSLYIFSKIIITRGHRNLAEKNIVSDLQHSLLT